MLKNQLERISMAMIYLTPEDLKTSYCNLKSQTSTEEENTEQYFPARDDDQTLLSHQVSRLAMEVTPILSEEIVAIVLLSSASCFC